MMALSIYTRHSYTGVRAILWNTVGLEYKGIQSATDSSCCGWNSCRGCRTMQSVMGNDTSCVGISDDTDASGLCPGTGWYEVVLLTRGRLGSSCACINFSEIKLLDLFEEQETVRVSKHLLLMVQSGLQRPSGSSSDEQDKPRPAARPFLPVRSNECGSWLLGDATASCRLWNIIQTVDPICEGYHSGAACATAASSAAPDWMGSSCVGCLIACALAHA